MDNLEFKKNLLVINDELNSFEIELKNIVNNKKNFLTDKLNSFLFDNPKRLRPIFIFLFAKILKINSDIVEKIALATELIHSASLIHDDILDEDIKRRQVILNTYNYARINDDLNVYFVDGKHLYDGYNRDLLTVDGTHPNDIGMYSIYEKIKVKLEEVLYETK